MPFVFDPRDFGAAGDGVTNDTAPVQAAIDAAAVRGGRVLLAGGCFLCGTLYLKSRITLEVAAGATLLASPRIGDYPADTHHNRYRNEPELDRCFLFARDCEQITLCGDGTIDGNAPAFPNPGSIHRPMLLRVLRCRHVRVQGLRLVNAAAWTTAFLDSEFLHAVDLYIENHTNYNGDGLDFDGCRHVYVRGCHLEGTDDNLCLQSSGLPVQDVHISDCSFTSLCAGIRIGLKSIGEISGVVISNCTMRDVRREGIKLECTEGGSITDILVQNIAMHNVRRPIFAILNNRFRPDDLGSSLELDHMPPIGTMARLRFAGITAVDDESMTQCHRRFGQDIMGEPRFGGCRFDAHPDHPIRDVTITDFRYRAVGGVRLADLPDAYPEVPDRLLDPDVPGSENYWPDWSRTTHLDLRHVRGLHTERLDFTLLHPDERPAMLAEE